MRITITEDPDLFAGAAGSWLARAPVSNNVLLTALATQQAGQAKGDHPATYAWVHDDGAVLGALRWPPPLPATMTAMPEAAATALATELAARPISLPGVNGPRAATAAFATRWQELTGQRIGHVRELVISQLDNVRLSQWPTGRMRHAEPAEAPLLTGWITKILADAGLPAAEATARQQIDEQLAGHRLFVWEDDGQLVAVTGHAAPVAGVALVHGGFAPPEHRTSWYGTAVVAAVSALLIDSGCASCIGITDHANPHAAGTLRAIGYRPVDELCDYKFQPATRPA